jgi:hypothetical protein
VHEVSTRLLGDAVHGKGGLALPVAFDLRTRCEAAAGCGFGAGAVAGEVYVGGDAGEEFGHCGVVGGFVLEEDGDAEGGFHHDFWGRFSVRVFNVDGEG